MKNDARDNYPPKRILEHEKYLRRVNLWEKVADLVGWAVMILASALPLLFVYWSIKAVAGKATTVSLQVAATFVLTVGGAGCTALIAWFKNKSQKKELRRLRRRIQSLESQLGLPTSDNQ